jgi:hypothetical protein
VADGAADPTPAPASDDPIARLGRFHPALQAPLARLLGGREIVHRIRVHDEEVEVLVDPRVRDELRGALVLGWSPLLAQVDQARAAEVRALDGDLPGWFDAPRGGHVDRHGRVIVDAADDADSEASRVVGPALLVGGVVVAFVGWSVLDLDAMVVAGVGLALAGLLVPR